MAYIYKCHTGHTTIRKRYLVDIGDFVKGQCSFYHRKTYQTHPNLCRKMDFFNGKETVGAIGSALAQTNPVTTITRDSVTVLLQGITIPGKGFLHLDDSPPYMINAGNVALHIPCDANSKPDVNIIIGQKPGWKVVEPDIIKELSQPGIMCLFHVDVNSDLQKKIYQTDVALQNPSNQSITFPPSSTAIAGRG